MTLVIILDAALMGWKTHHPRSAMIRHSSGCLTDHPCSEIANWLV